MRLGTDQGLIKGVLEQLDGARERYAVLSPDESVRVIEWLEKAFPIAAWGRVRWSEVPDSTCTGCATTEDTVRTFQDLCEGHRLQDPTVTITWTNALAPSLRLPLAVVRRHAACIFEADFDTWIVCEAGGWCIEVYHEGELCFGRARPTGP